MSHSNSKSSEHCCRIVFFAFTLGLLFADVPVSILFTSIDYNSGEICIVQYIPGIRVRPRIARFRPISVLLTRYGTGSLISSRIIPPLV